jgi:hypothetical protein
MDATGAWRVITETERRLNQLKRQARDIPLTFRSGFIVNQLNEGNKRAAGGRDGDPNTPFAGGGWTGPGAKYQPAGVVHADEFVFSKEATHGHVAELTALHNRLRGYADGGLVQRFPTQMLGGPSIDYDRLASALASNRQLYGDVHINGDPTMFRRQMEEDRRKAGIGGLPGGVR